MAGFSEQPTMAVFQTGVLYIKFARMVPDILFCITSITTTDFFQGVSFMQKMVGSMEPRVMVHMVKQWIMLAQCSESSRMAASMKCFTDLVRMDHGILTKP